MDRRLTTLCIDTGVTLLLWLYFTLGFVVFFLPQYLWALIFHAKRETAFQRLNNRFYRGFFVLLGLLARDLIVRVSDQVRQLKGCVVVSNHLSYLDPLLFIATFPRHKTIVKSVFFRTPIFGWFITRAGYMPASAAGPAGGLMIRNIEAMGKFFNDGGILFVFPEGTRHVAPGDLRLQDGAFKIAGRFKVPLAVVRICNTEKVFQPGRFLFRTRESIPIEMGLVKTLNEGTAGETLKAKALKETVKEILSQQIC